MVLFPLDRQNADYRLFHLFQLFKIVQFGGFFRLFFFNFQFSLNIVFMFLRFMIDNITIINTLVVVCFRFA